jgi:hypothetical protein
MHSIQSSVRSITIEGGFDDSNLGGSGVTKSGEEVGTKPAILFGVRGPMSGDGGAEKASIKLSFSTGRLEKVQVFPVASLGIKARSCIVVFISS